MRRRLSALLQEARRQISVYRCVAADPRTPWAARWVLGLAIVYLVSPIDLIPDCIPLFGQLDDLLLVPLLLWIALRLVPRPVLADARRTHNTGLLNSTSEVPPS